MNDILKHLDACPVKKDRRVLSENVDKIGKIVRSREREDETSIEKGDNREILSYKVYKNLVESTNNDNAGTRPRDSKPQT